MDENKLDVKQIARDLRFGKFLNLLLTDYKDKQLSDGQLYTLYQKCMDVDFEEIIKTGAAEFLF